MNVGAMLLWGFIATAALTTLMEAAQGLGLTRMAVPFILGTMFTPDRTRAGVIGVGVQFANGWAFSVVYALVFESLHRATWWLGAVGGLAHGLAVLSILLPVLPGLHPRMANEERGPEPTRALEPPGFLGLHYGRRTPLVALLAHIVYGAILGGGYRLAGG